MLAEVHKRHKTEPLALTEANTRPHLLDVLQRQDCTRRFVIIHHDGVIHPGTTPANLLDFGLTFPLVITLIHAWFLAIHITTPS